MRATVAICTRNRARSLHATLASLRSLRIPDGVSWDVLVVDNGSTDDTAAVAQGWAGRLPVRCVCERRKGVAFARNTALRETPAELLLSLDDDATPDPGWLAAIVDAAQAYPQAAYFGGPVVVKYAGRVDKALLREAPFSIRGFAPSDRRQVRGPALPHFIGVNMAYRLDLIRERFAFDTRLGPGAPGGVLGGEETQLQDDLDRAGLPGVFVPEAKVTHHVDAARVTWRYLTRWHFRASAAMVRRGLAPHGESWFGLPRWYFALLLARVAQLPAMVASGDRARLFNTWIAIVRNVGTIVHSGRRPA